MPEELQELVYRPGEDEVPIPEHVEVKFEGSAQKVWVNEDDDVTET